MEFKRGIPEKSEKYMKTVVASANGGGGKIVYGIEDKTREVIGVQQEDAFRIMDGLTTSICDSCTLMIAPVVTMASIDEEVGHYCYDSGRWSETILHYYGGKEKGTYVRVTGTTRHADSFIIKGANRCFD